MSKIEIAARAGLLTVILLLTTLVTAFAADTGEIEVTQDVDGQPYRARSVGAASDDSGNAVVAWAQHDTTYPNPQKVYARRYDSSGASVQLIPVVALPSSRIAGYVDVAMNSSGAFVVAWTQSFVDSDGYSVHAAVYDSSGSVVRSPFQVNTSEIGDQWNPAVAIDDAGNFLNCLGAEGLRLQPR
jgi:hypothetical protein